MTLTVYDKAHKHNALYVQCLQACIDGKPLNLQLKAQSDCEWFEVPPCGDGTPMTNWQPAREYRIKPPEPVLITRTVTYPAPMTEAPAVGIPYFAAETNGTCQYRWDGDKIDLSALQQGRAFTTQADAQACWDALFGSQS